MNSTDKGLLVVSFGTTHKDTCRETIGAIEDHLAKAMPDRSFYRGWTSSFIIKRLKERDGIEIDTVAEALDRMASDGIRDVLIVPTHLLAGAEYDKVMAAVEGRTLADRNDRESADAGSVPAGAESNDPARTFEKIAVSRPLLDTEEDLKRLAEVIAAELLGSDGDTPTAILGQVADVPTANLGQVVISPDALVLMGHGSADKPEINEVYVRLEEEFHRAGHDNVFVGTVEGSPSIDEITDRLRAWAQNKRNHLMAQDADPHKQTDAGDPEEQSKQAGMTVKLAPLMIVAGDHAVKDMAGDGPDSWKNRIAEAMDTDDSSETTKVEVIPIIRGLGSYAGVQNMFLDKAREQM